MEKKKRFLVTVVTLFLLIGLGKWVNGNPLGNFIAGWKEAATEFMVKPKWHLSTKVTLDKRSLTRQRGEWGTVFLTDPAKPKYETTLSIGDLSKANVEISHQLEPYTASQTRTQSYGSEILSVRSTLPVKPDCFDINMELGYDKYRYGPGIDIPYDPFLAMGLGAGFTEERTERSSRFGVGFNLNLPADNPKFSLSTTIGGVQRSYFYPAVETPSAEETGVEKQNIVDAMNVYGNFNSSFRLSSKAKINFSGDFAPDQKLGYYTATGYAEMHYTTKRYRVETEYWLNPVLKVSGGYSYAENISGQSYGAGGEAFGLTPEERRTPSDVFYVKVDFRP